MVRIPRILVDHRILGAPLIDFEESYHMGGDLVTPLGVTMSGPGP